VDRDKEKESRDLVKDVLADHSIVGEIKRQSKEIQQSLVRLINKSREQGTSCLFFLDKSARPVAWMYRQIWKGFVDKGSIPKEEAMPVIRFINIGRNQDENMFDSDSTAMELAKKKYKIPGEGSIMVVDEHKEEGTTLTKAGKVIHSLFPDRDIISFVVFGAVPPWFGEGELIGIEEKILDNKGKIEEIDRVWAFPLSSYETMAGTILADKEKSGAFRQLLKSEIVDHVVSESVRRKDGSILLPDMSIGFRAE